MNYEDYLKTDHWKATRKKALKAADYHCAVCCDRRSKLHVHHNNYERLHGERPADLIVLCEECHAIFHDKIAKPVPLPPDDMAALKEAMAL